MYSKLWFVPGNEKAETCNAEYKTISLKTIQNLVKMYTTIDKAKVNSRGSLYIKKCIIICPGQC